MVSQKIHLQGEWITFVQFYCILFYFNFYLFFLKFIGTHEDKRTVLYNTKSLDGIKPNTNPKTNTNPNANLIQLFYAFFEHRPMIFDLANLFIPNVQKPKISLITKSCYNHLFCLQLAIMYISANHQSSKLCGKSNFFGLA